MHSRRAPLCVLHLRGAFEVHLDLRDCSHKSVFPSLMPCTCLVSTTFSRCSSFPAFCLPHSLHPAPYVELNCRFSHHCGHSNSFAFCGQDTLRCGCTQGGSNPVSGPCLQTAARGYAGSARLHLIDSLFFHTYSQVCPFFHVSI